MPSTSVVIDAPRSTVFAALRLKNAQMAAGESTAKYDRRVHNRIAVAALVVLVGNSSPLTKLEAAVTSTSDRWKRPSLMWSSMLNAACLNARTNPVALSIDLSPTSRSAMRDFGLSLLLD